MELIYLIILVALTQYIYFTFRTGLSRNKYGVKAPKCAGDETWERLFRVQQNTLEQLILFVPGMLLFAHYVSSKWVLLPGIAFVVGRALYSHLYIKNPESRTPGVALSLFSNVILVVGSLIGLGLALLKAQ
jgi:uncharacterized MAPEG superfamily protein